MSFQWIAACAAVILVLLAASPYVQDAEPALRAEANSIAASTLLAQATSTETGSQTEVTESTPDATGQNPSGASAATLSGKRTDWENAKDESAEAVGAISDATKRTANQAWDKTKETSSKAWQATQEGASRAAESTSAATSDAWKATRETASDAASATAKGANKAWEATKSATSSIWKQITDTAKLVTGNESGKSTTQSESAN